MIEDELMYIKNKFQKDNKMTDKEYMNQVENIYRFRNKWGVINMNKIRIEKNGKTKQLKLSLNGEILKGVINTEINYSYDVQTQKRIEMVKITFINSEIEVIETE